jgi:hypothetical protein
MDAWLQAEARQCGEMARAAAEASVVLVALEMVACRRDSERERRVKDATDVGRWLVRAPRVDAPPPEPPGEAIACRPRLVLTDDWRAA